MHYLKTMIIFKNFCEAKTFNQTIRFVFEKLLKKWGSIIGGRLHPASTDEIKTLNLTISTLRIYIYWNDRRSRRVFLCFYSAIFQLMSAKFQTFAYNSRTVLSSYMKL